MFFSRCWAQMHLNKHREEVYMNLQVEEWVILDLVVGGARLLNFLVRS